MKEKMLGCWTLFLVFGTAITEFASQEEIDARTNSSLHSDSWVRIPDEWRSSGGESMLNEESGDGGRLSGPEPFFDHAMMTNLSEQLGNHAFLRCRVKNLGDRTVSWIRRRDWHILTSGRVTYTNDNRFSIIHNEGTDEWTLQIKYVQLRDNGTYECQVSMGQGTMSHFFNLNVLVPKAYILGAKELHVQIGTVINLVCIIDTVGGRSSPEYLYWYHNNEMVSYSAGVSVQTEPSSGSPTHSRLVIPSAAHQHAGNYTCKASNTLPASVFVFISDGDKTAAIQGQGSCSLVPPSLLCVSLLLLTSQRLS